MKTGCFFLIGAFICNLSLAQSKPELLPYKGGEQAFKKDLKAYIGQHIKSNDSVAIYYVEIKKGENRKIDFEITGSGENDSLTKVINNFFTGSLQNWDVNRLQDVNVIAPVYIWSVCDLSKNGDVDWAGLLNSKLPETKKALFVSPLVVMYVCGGEPDGDKNEIKSGWGKEKSAISKN